MIPGILLRSCRYIHSSAVWQASDKALLGKLRKKTGFPISKCQKALTMFENDFIKAETWLKEQAMKEGWAKAQKLQDRPMSQGLVGITMHNNIATMIEVNCETDFVARNPKFHKLVSTSAAACLSLAEAANQSKVLLPKSDVEKLAGPGGKTLSDLVALSIGDLGENMALRRAVVMKVPDGKKLGTYVHSTGQNDIRDDKCIMGKYGAIVIFDQSEVSEGVLPSGELGKQLCQHIVGMNPLSLGSEPTKPAEQTDTPPDHVEEAPKKKSKKKKKEETEELRLLYQEFLLDPDLKVMNFLEQNNATVLDFARLECGEELEDSG